MSDDPPTATVVTSVRRDDAIVTLLQVDQPLFSPVAPASLWLCSEGEPSTCIMELHKVIARRGNELTFATYGSEHGPLAIGKTYHIISWWDNRQLATAQSDSSRWRRQTFVPANAVSWIRSDGVAVVRKIEDGETIPDGAELLPDGWEHEHCNLCWAVISPCDGEEHGGYTDGRAWLCKGCYDKFAVSGFGKRLGGVS